MQTVEHAQLLTSTKNKKLCFAFASVPRKQTSVLHMTAVLHINCHLFEIKHACRFQIDSGLNPLCTKKNETERGLSLCIPLSNFCVVRRRANKKQFHLPRNSSGNPTRMQVQKKTCLVVACKRVHMHMLRGSYVLPSLQPKWPWQVPCCKHPFGSSSLRSSPHAFHIRTNQTSS